MALVVLLKGINVGGHRTFRPVVNIGAAGTFVIRQPVTRTQLSVANDGTKDPAKARSAGWRAFDPEAALYFIFGLAVVVFGLFALARWVTAEWQAGARLIVVAVCVVGVSVLVGAVVSLRRRRIALFLVCAIVALGSLSTV